MKPLKLIPLPLPYFGLSRNPPFEKPCVTSQMMPGSDQRRNETIYERACPRFCLTKNTKILKFILTQQKPRNDTIFLCATQVWIKTTLRWFYSFFGPFFTGLFSNYKPEVSFPSCAINHKWGKKNCFYANLINPNLHGLSTWLFTSTFTKIMLKRNDQSSILNANYLTLN